MAKICGDCGKEFTTRGKRCPPCSDKEYERLEKIKSEARKAKRREAEAANPKLCGCGVKIRSNATWCAACYQKKREPEKKAEHQRRMERLRAAPPVKKEVTIQPHRPQKVVRQKRKVIISDDQQRVLDLLAREKEIEQTAKTLGLKYEPGKPLASPVKVLSRSEIAAIARTLTPPQKVKHLTHYVL